MKSYKFETQSISTVVLDSAVYHSLLCDTDLPTYLPLSLIEFTSNIAVLARSSSFYLALYFFVGSEQDL